MRLLTRSDHKNAQSHPNQPYIANQKWLLPPICKENVLKPRNVESLLKKNGWIRKKGTKGGHRQYTHPTLKGKIAIPWHNKDLKQDTLDSILTQAGLKETKS
jgi:predicted RNA binding protein YcfA (HicA-like mRNA interferase family)